MAKKGGFGSLFFKEDDSTEEVKEVAKEQPKKTSSTPTSVGSVNLVSPVSNAERNEFAEFLNGIYQQGNFPGPDYQEFTDALKEVENEPMDEKSKFTTIFVGFKVQGVTKSRLLDTGGKYVVQIEDQVKGFNSEIENVLNTEVAGKQAKVNEITNENAEIEKQMIALTEKKNKNNELAQKINSEINEQVSALNIKKASFVAAANDFIATIKTNLEKIKQYLPEPKI